MKRLLLVVAGAVAAAVLSACSAPADQPCLYDSGVAHSYLSANGKTLLVTCKDGKVIVRHE